jgi:hypothetical protein
MFFNVDVIPIIFQSYIIMNIRKSKLTKKKNNNRINIQIKNCSTTNYTNKMETYLDLN